MSYYISVKLNCLTGATLAGKVLNWWLNSGHLLDVGGIGFKLIDEQKRFQHSVIRQPLILPWKSEAFKGIVKVS